ncbi:MAG: tyrosine--tRNA ligase [Dehalococcoidia bacterium]
MSVRVPDDAEIEHLTTRAVAEIIPRDEFIRLLKSGRQLRLKMGFDPSAPDLTLGHAVGLRKLRQLQELGHTVVVIVGDWTARIGDPSGRSATRPMLTEEEVRANAETYLRQFFKIVDRERTEIRPQSEWFDKFTLETIIKLAASFTVAQMLQREDFGQRYREGQPLGVHELLYPIMQAYDSVAVDADVEFGGTDQTFNLLVGRELQQDMGERPQCVFTVPLLVGTDGKVKMSKSLGNYIALEDPPDEVFGKVMSLPDEQILPYFSLVTDVPDNDLAEIERQLGERLVNPMELKMRLGREIVTFLHGPEAATAAEESFKAVFSRGQLPADMPEVLVGEDLLQSLVDAGLIASKAEGKRLFAQGAVERNGEKITAPDAELDEGDVLRIGRKRFVRVRTA